MGSGKSRIGRLLAGRLGLRFEDLDELITEVAGDSIKGIFSTLGEAKFREMERELLYSKLQDTHRVLSLGGGALSAPEVVDNIKKDNVLVFISPPFEELLIRIQGNKKRPLVLDANGSPKSISELERDLRPLYDKRCELYTMANVIFNTNPAWDPYQATSELLQLLRQKGYAD